MMRIFATILLITYCSVAMAVLPLPQELHGYWVPSGLPCSSELGIRVSAHDIQFRKGERTLSFPVEACFSCEGGARYSGIVIWGIPSGAVNQPFTAYFNVGERKGITVIEIGFPGLQSQFPLNNLELKHCVA